MKEQRTIKDQLANFMHRAGIIKILNQYQKLGDKHPLLVLAYHRINDIARPESYPYDIDLISASSEDFDQQVSYLKKDFDVIASPADIKECLKDRKMRPVIITFDDGYRDNYEIAYPILRRHNVPAIMFVSTGYIETGKTFWFEETAYLVKNTKKEKLVFFCDGKKHEYYVPEDRSGLVNQIDSILKKVNESVHAHVMQQLRESLDTELKNRELVETLKWSDIIEMNRNGIEIGSHSASHLNLALISNQMLISEIYDSKKAIEDNTGKPAYYFSYPIGSVSTFNKTVQEKLREAGFQFIFSHEHGINSIYNLNRYAIKRIHVEQDCNASLFKANLIIPELFVR